MSLGRVVCALAAAICLAASAAAGCGEPQDKHPDNPLSGHLNQAAYENCVEEGQLDASECRDFWTVK